jgi:hypothetical protein
VECATASTITATVEPPAPAKTGGISTSDHALFAAISPFVSSAFDVFAPFSYYNV